MKNSFIFVVILQISSYIIVLKQLFSSILRCYKIQYINYLSFIFGLAVLTALDLQIYLQKECN